MAQRAGWEARVQVAPYDSSGSIAALVYLAVAEWSFDPEAPSLRADNTEGKPGNPVVAANAPGFASRVRNIKSAAVMLKQATYDEADSPMVAPYKLREATYVRVRIYPAGNSIVGGGPFHQIDQMYIHKITLAGRVGDLQPFTVMGESDGNYSFV